MSDITEFFGGALKPTERKRRVEKRGEEERKADPVEQLLVDRGYLLLERLGDLAVVARDPFGQIHYICVIRIGGRLCGAEFFNVVDLARHLHLVHERNVSEMQPVLRHIAKQVREGKLKLEQLRDVLPEKLMLRIEQELT